jgi:hypothetical protein
MGANSTVRFSASIASSSLLVLKRRAKRLHGGNVSAVISELAEWAREREGREALLEWLGAAPTMTERERKDLDAEIHGRAPRKTTRAKPRKIG